MKKQNRMRFERILCKKKLIFTIFLRKKNAPKVHPVNFDIR